MAATVAGLVVGALPASASTDGVGTTNTKTSVLTLQVGNLLNLGLLVDTGNANIDPHAGSLGAAASLEPLSVSSPVLHLSLAAPTISSSQPGGSSTAAGNPLTLSSLGVPASIATATIQPAQLSSSYAAGSAKAGMIAAEVDHLTVAQGALLSINLLKSTLGADALSPHADGLRGFQLGDVSALDLGALLKGIGIDLSSLPVSALSNLSAKLGVAVPSVAGGDSLAGDVTNISTALTQLRQQLADTSTQTVSQVVDTTNSILGQVGLPTLPSTTSSSVSAVVAQINSAITTLQDQLVSLLTGVLSKLDVAPLVKVSGTQLGINTTAADMLKDSSAGVTIAPLTVTVAGTPITIDPQAVVNTINGVVSQANSALNGLLSQLGLPTNLVSLTLLDQQHSVSQAHDYITAAAGVTLLDLKIAPISLSAIQGAINTLGGTAASSLLGSAAPALTASSAMAAVNSALGQAAPLLGGTELQIASLAGASTYTFAPVPAVTGSTPASPAHAAPVITNLPHTGANPELAVLGVALVVLALGVARWRRAVHARVVETSLD